MSSSPATPYNNGNSNSNGNNGVHVLSSSYQKETQSFLPTSHRNLSMAHYTESEDFDAYWQRRCYRCPMGKLLVAFVVGMFVLTGILVARPILRDIYSQDNKDANQDAAKRQVYVTSSGEYKIQYNDAVSPQETTFAQLASRMLPPWYEASLMAIQDHLQLDLMSDPSTVSNCRKALLYTRDMLDVFSPVFTTQSIWGSLRGYYKEGYEKVGYLQDLNHSKVTYTHDLLEQKIQDVLTWKHDFEEFQQRHDIPTFLQRGVHPKVCVRHRDSHLFWSEEAQVPCGTDLALISLQQLASVQLTNALQYWNIVRDYQSVMEVENEMTFHNLRKELRIFLDEANLFEDILLAADTIHERHLRLLEEAQHLLGDIHDHWTAYDIYVTSGTHVRDQQQLALVTDTMWKDFQHWATQQDFEGVLQTVLDSVSASVELP
jgi:hypothetical protein